MASGLALLLLVVSALSVFFNLAGLLQGSQALADRTGADWLHVAGSVVFTAAAGLSLWRMSRHALWIFPAYALWSFIWVEGISVVYLAAWAAALLYIGYLRRNGQLG